MHKKHHYVMSFIIFLLVGWLVAGSKGFVFVLVTWIVLWYIDEKKPDYLNLKDLKKG